MEKNALVRDPSKGQVETPSDVRQEEYNLSALRADIDNDSVAL
jgi:hypothetical protein